MDERNQGSGGNAPKLVATHAVVLYRPSDGRVAHLHTVQVFEGGRSVSRGQTEVEAREHAKRLGHDVASLKVAHIDRVPEVHGGLHYDEATKSLKATRLDLSTARRRQPQNLPPQRK